MAVTRKEATSLSLLLLLFSFLPCDCFYAINKCCPEGEQFDENLKCANVTSGGTANGLPIDEKYDTFNMSARPGEVPCRGRNFFVKSSDWFELDEEGTLHLYDDVEDTVVANYSKEAYCVERWNLGEDEYENIAYLCSCVEHLCISKCCASGYQIHTDRGSDGRVNASWCAPYDSSGGAEDWHHRVISGSNISRYREMITSTPNCGSRYTLHLTGKYTLQDDDSIYSETDGLILPGDYCGDYMKGENGSGRVGTVLACVNDQEDFVKLLFFAVLTAVGALFLLVTVVLHVWLPELAGLHGRCLVAHASWLLLGYVCTIPHQLAVFPLRHYSCYIIGYLMQFSFLASFFWLNIMCVDMSYTFSAFRPNSKGSQKERDRRKFIWYSLYAWGCTSAFTIAALVVDFIPAVPTSSPFKPNLGVVKCWFNSTGSLLLYFYGPMGVLLLVNLFLFVFTTWRIIIMSRGSDALHQGDSARHGGSPSNKEKQRYILYAKMFSLMGVTWLTEIISWAVGGPSYIWYLTDSINLLRAVFIFIIFCWKPKVWTGLRRKFSHIKGTILKRLGKTYEEHQGPDQHSEPSTLSTGSVNKSNSATLEMRTVK